MYIQSVLSFLGAWGRLNSDCCPVLNSVREILQEISPGSLSKALNRQGSLSISGRSVYERFREISVAKGWAPHRHIGFGRDSLKKFNIDYAHQRVGIEVCLGKLAWALQAVYANFPAFVKAGDIDIGILILPVRSLARQMSSGIAAFEGLKEMLLALQPLPLRYPFAIVGYSADSSVPEVSELTTELDAYLIRTLGLTLDEILLLRERPNYDFKVQLPENKKLAQEVCGFANMRGGGLILLGITDDGAVSGFDRNVLDDLQLQMTNVIRSRCAPIPTFDFQAFPVPVGSGSSILIVRVLEMEQKPCMSDERVYIRSGPSVRAASPEEIRRIVLG